ncbi:MAG: CvpA family protein [Burkholderiales bacterium]|nr:CvpA family protein [Burkholderiales bacterium]
MTWFDYAVLLIIGLSLLVGWLRGAVKEILSLLSWVAAFLLANAFAGDLATALLPSIINPALRTVAAYAIVFIATLLVMMLLRIAVSEMVKAMGLGNVDKTLGLIVGFSKGIVIVLIGVLAAGMTALPQEPFWRGAVVAPWFETLAVAVKPWLPEGLARRINFRSAMKA